MVLTKSLYIKIKWQMCLENQNKTSLSKSQVCIFAIRMIINKNKSKVKICVNQLKLKKLQLTLTNF